MSRKQPTTHEIQQVMNETGMEDIQARNHLIQRYALSEQVKRDLAERNKKTLK